MSAPTRARAKLGAYLWDSLVHRPSQPVWWGADIPTLTPAEALEVWAARRDARRSNR